MTSESCELCQYIDGICDKLPTEESRRKCKELSQRVMKGEVDGLTARRELLKHVDEHTFNKIAQDVLKTSFS